MWSNRALKHNFGELFNDSLSSFDLIARHLLCGGIFLYFAAINLTLIANRVCINRRSDFRKSEYIRKGTKK